MKEIILLLIFSFAILGIACKKKDLTDSTDITQYNWMVKKVKIIGDKLKTPILTEQPYL